MDFAEPALLILCWIFLGPSVTGLQPGWVWGNNISPWVCGSIACKAAAVPGQSLLQ